MKNILVTKRNGTKQPFCEKKLTKRFESLLEWGENPATSTNVSVPDLVSDVVIGLPDGVKTTELDKIASVCTANRIFCHPDNDQVAARIVLTSLYKQTHEKLWDVWRDIQNETHTHPKGGAGGSCLFFDESKKDMAMRIDPVLYNWLDDDTKSLAAIEEAIDHTTDLCSRGFFGIATLLRSYLIRLHGVVVERPQHLLMRVALGIHCTRTKPVTGLADALETYHSMSRGEFTHATPTLFFSGTCMNQMSSCFLIAMKDDSIEGIYDTLKECALVSKSAGGVGLHIHNIRARGARIRKTGGVSNGLVPMLHVYNDTAVYVDQGGGKRKGSFAVYLEPWHADIEEFIQTTNNHFENDLVCRDLYTGLWVPDLFMERVESDQEWSLFCPDSAPGLSDVWGEDFNGLYEKYEGEGRARKTIRARDLFETILKSQIETGMPFMLFKDACNAGSNQRHLGTIKSSNLCTEIVQYSDKDETAVCNLASIALPTCVNTDTHEFDFDKLGQITRRVTDNMNRILDITFYPTATCRKSNQRHRPIGLGVQGLSDAFALLRLPFESEEAKELNRAIFECIYYHALDTSCELARLHGPYETYEGSPASQGLLQMDLFFQRAPHRGRPVESQRWDWQGLRERIRCHGLRNSLLTAPMPTASTAQILGNTECFEIPTTNLYSRRTLAGEFVVYNHHLVRELEGRGLWNQDMAAKLVESKGSVQNVEDIPSDLKELFKTMWEVKGKAWVEMAMARAPYIDQSQSMSLFMKDPDLQTLKKMLFYGWKNGAKTGMYYCRTRPASDPLQFTVKKTPTSSPDEKIADKSKIVCSDMEDGMCMMCSS